MKKFYDGVIKMRVVLIILFLIAAGICGYCRQFISVNYDMNSYLPEDAPSTVAMDVMGEEFDGAIPNARVMIKDVSQQEALKYKEKLEAVDGVSSVMWLDDNMPYNMPLSMYSKKLVHTYYKDKNALFTVTIDEDKINSSLKLYN